MSISGVNRIYDLSQSDDIIFISRKDFEGNSFPSHTSNRRYPFSYLDMHSLNQFINMSGRNNLKYPRDSEYERLTKSVIHFNQLDYLDTEQSSQSGQNTESFPLKHNHDPTHNNGNNSYQNKSNSSSLTEINQSSMAKIGQKPQKVALKDILNNSQNIDPFLLLKKKYMSKKLLRQQLQEQDQDIDQAALTYYQRKKNFIQKLKEDDMLLDWDSIKKDDKLYETMYIGGASRKRKSKKKDYEQSNSQQINSSTILQPQPPQQQQQNASASSAINSSNLYQKEAKSYRKVPRSSRYESSNDNQIEEDKNGINLTEREVREKDRVVEKKEDNFLDGIEITLVEVSIEELEQRKQDFKHQQFLKEKYQNKSYIYISSRAQAAIPQIRPIEDVRNSWVLKDLDSLLAYKKSPEYNQLEIYMNKFFGLRTPQQVFSILKQNNFNLKGAIDYCNMNSVYLKDYYTIKDQEAKKKVTKRKIEKRAYL